MPQHIEEQGSRKLAVALGGGGRGHSLAKLSALRGSPGWLVGRAEGTGGVTSITEWRFEGFTERDGEQYLYGPEVPGMALTEVLELPLAEALPFLARLADALATLASRGYALFPIASDAVVLTDSGGTLFLPPALMKELRGVRPFAENRDTFEALNHPDLAGEPLACFTLGAALYRVAAGRFPFAGASEEEIHERARKLDVVPLADLVAGFEPAASDLAAVSIGRSRAARAAAEARATLEGWRDGLAAWARSGLVRAVGAAETERVARGAASREQAAGKRFATRAYWQRNWRLAAIIGGIVIVVGLVVGSIMKGVFLPRPTYGWGPRQVVTAFYEGMNTLDTQLMEACVVGGAGKAEVSEVTNLYVISRVQMGYEGKSNTISAGQWAKDGRPKLQPGTALFGVTDLTITQVSDTQAPQFQVDYVKWTPLAPDTSSPEASAPMQSQGTRISDRVYLRRNLRFVDKLLRRGYPGDWVIDRIDRTTGATVPPPQYLPQPAPGATGTSGAGAGAPGAGTPGAALPAGSSP